MKLKQYSRDHIKPFDKYVYEYDLQMQVAYPPNYSPILGLCLIVCSVMEWNVLGIAIFIITSGIRWRDFEIDKWLLFTIFVVICGAFGINLLVLYLVPYLWYITKSPAIVVFQILLDILFVVLIPMGFN